MKLPRLAVSSLFLAVLFPLGAFAAQTPAQKLNTLGAHERQSGNLDAAVADFTKAIELDPTYAVAYSNRGRAKRAKGDLQGAIADFTRAIELDPKHEVGVLDLASVQRFKASSGKPSKSSTDSPYSSSDSAVWADQQSRIDSLVDELRRRESGRSGSGP